MCERCIENLEIDFETELEAYQRNLEAVVMLNESAEELTEKDKVFATDLCTTFQNSRGLSSRQWYWVHQLVQRVKGATPIEGNFKAIQVMFILSSTVGGLKRPKVRLLSSEGTFVQLNFDVEKSEVLVYIDGWAGNGFRKFAGWIRENKLVPYRTDRMKPDVVAVIKQLAADPIGTAKAMAAVLGVCLYCGQRLSDEESKARGYGATCAANYGMPWGKKAA